MIPRANIIQWRAYAPWPLEAQIEQDMVLSRILIEIFSDPFLCSELAFRGGTALHKIFLKTPARHSEDIDLVMIHPGSIGKILDSIRGALDHWLGTPRRTRTENRVKLIYKFESESHPITNIRVKIEINTVENITVLGLHHRPYSMNNPWYTGSANITTYMLEELLGTKLRALFQRKKGRDLFDLSLVTRFFPALNFDQVVQCFQVYMSNAGARVSRAEFEANLAEKINDPVFKEDIVPLLSQEMISLYNINAEMTFLLKNFIEKLPGDPWKG